MYVGKSPTHASTVPLVLNPDTGTITPRFHIVFDDWFQTVSTDVDALPDFNAPAWKQLFGESEFQYEFESGDLEQLRDLTDNIDTSIEALHDAAARERVQSAMDLIRAPPSSSATSHQQVPKSHVPPVPVSQPLRTSHPSTSSPSHPVLPSSSSVRPSSTVVRPEGERATLVRPPNVSKTPLVVPKKPPSPKAIVPTSVSMRPTSPKVVTVPTLRRSYRLKATSPSQSQESSSLTLRRSRRLQSLPPATTFLSIFAAFGINTMSILAASKGTDSFTFDEAMRSEYKEEFIAAANKEIRELEQHNTWKEVPIDSVTESIIPNTWVFTIKRRPDGSIKKFKARLCLRGDLQKGQFESYAPVTTFSSLRILLITALMFKWKTCCIDFVNAFVQAKLDVDVWMHLPRGFYSNNKGKTCLKLLRSLYGAVFSPRLWYQLLERVLLEIGFIKSKHDPCLFLKENIYLVIHVDDCGIAYEDEDALNWLIKELEKKNLLLTKEGSFNEYLGIQYERENDKIILTQIGLIKKIIATVGLSNCNPNWVPASPECLGIDPEGESMQESWCYPSVIGMLLYLSSNTRSDITFAVSQCARFCHNPKQSHATAVKMIVRYLFRTQDKGTVITLPTRFNLECFTDSDFAGLFKRDPDASPSSAKSRSAYVIKFCGCPLLWKSQLQPTIALSTGEAEYYALSQSMRALLPIYYTLEEFFSIVQAPCPFHKLASNLTTVVRVDNTSALTLARDQQITSRNRHYHCRFHFFWSHINEKITVEYVESKLQDADYLSKGLTRLPFEANRLRVQGW